MTVSVQGTVASDASAVNQQIQDFKDGKTKITKDALVSIVTGNIKQGQTPSATIVDMLDSYDKIDKNNDGMSYDEFETYKSTPKGMLASIGLTSSSLNQQINSMSLSLLGSNSTDSSSSSSSSLLSSLSSTSSSLSSSLGQQPSLLDSGLFGDSSTSSSSSDSVLLSSTDSSSSQLSQLMQNYSATNTTGSDISSLISELG